MALQRCRPFTGEANAVMVGQSLCRLQANQPNTVAIVLRGAIARSSLLIRKATLPLREGSASSNRQGIPFGTVGTDGQEVERALLPTLGLASDTPLLQDDATCHRIAGL